MNSNLDHLVPFKKNHSIREAILSFFLATPIVKPEEFSALAERPSFDFQKFELITKQGFRIQVGGEQPLTGQPLPSSNVGFRFHKFGRNGQNTDVLAAESQDDAGRARLSFHDLDYSRWHNFSEKARRYIEEIANFRGDLFATAFSLQYVDEFTWQGEDDIPIDQVFNRSSDFLPTVFFRSKNSMYLMTTQKEVDENIYYERLEVRVDENRAEPLLTINHSITQPLNTLMRLAGFMADDSGIRWLNNAHAYNKELLASILVDEVSRKINLPVRQADLTNQETYEQSA